MCVWGKDDRDVLHRTLYSYLDDNVIASINRLLPSPEECCRGCCRVHLRLHIVVEQKNLACNGFYEAGIFPVHCARVASRWPPSCLCNAEKCTPKGNGDMHIFTENMIISVHLKIMKRRWQILKDFAKYVFWKWWEINFMSVWRSSNEKDCEKT